MSFQNCGTNPRYESINSNKGIQPTGTICPEPTPLPFTWNHISFVQDSGMMLNNYHNVLHLGLNMYATGGVLHASFKKDIGGPAAVSCYLNVDLTWEDLQNFYQLSNDLHICQSTAEHACVSDGPTEAWYLATTLPDPLNPAVGYDLMGFYPGMAPCTNSPLVCPSAPQLRALVKQKIDSSITPQQRASCPTNFLDTL